MSERPLLEAVLFDAGGTLVRLDFEWMAETLNARGIAVGLPALRRAEVVGRRRYDASRGGPAGPDGTPPPLGSQGDTQAYFGGLLEAAGVPPATIPEVYDRFRRRHREHGLWMRPMEGALAAIDGITGLAVRCAVVSNSDGRAAEHLRDCGITAGLDFVIDSHLVGVEKPDAGIFRIALGRLAVAPERALFVGDIRSVDEAGARAAGVHFVLIDPYGDYAAPGDPAIAGMHELVDWVRRHFRLPVGARRATPREPEEIGP